MSKQWIVSKVNACTNVLKQLKNIINVFTTNSHEKHPTYTKAQNKHWKKEKDGAIVPS